MSRSFVRTSWFRRSFAFAVAFGLLASNASVRATAPALASDASSSVVEQHWEVLDQTKLGLVATTAFPIQRGVLPGGTSKFDPQPTVTFEVAAKVSAGTGTWKVQLRDAGSLIAETEFSATGSSYAIQTASLTWPSADRALTEIRAVQSLGGTRILDIRKAYLKITQSGTVKKTAGRSPIATRQIVANTQSASSSDVIFYRHIANDFNPAPTVFLRLTGRVIQGQGAFALLDDDGLAASGSSATFENTEITSITVGPITLTDQNRYHLVASAAGFFGQLTPRWELYSADLIFEQSTTDTHGISKTVGWYPGISDPSDITTNAQSLGFLFRSPSITADEQVATWESGITRLTGSNELGVDLVAAGGSIASAAAVQREGEPNIAISVHSPVNLPAAATALDSRTIVGTGSSGRVRSSILRIAMILPDLVPPTALAFEAYPNPFSPDSAAPRDEAVIGATLLESLPWTVTIRESNNSLVRSITGSGTDVSATWDGTDSLGARMPDGAYMIGLEATDASGNAMSHVRWLTLGPAPTITDVVEDPIQMGSLITLTGQNFGPGLGNYGVTVNGENAIIGTWNNTQITAWLPPGLDPGTKNLSVWAADLTSASFDIEVSKLSAPPVGSDVVQGKISIRIKEGAAAEDIATALGDPASAVTATFPGSTSEHLNRWYDITTTIGNERLRAAAYAGNPDVEIASVEPIYAAQAWPDDKKIEDQWALKSVGAGINAPSAWDHTKGSTDLVIAVIDSGIGAHSDISTNLASGNDIDGNCLHGTRVAGVAAADTNNDLGIAGVGWKTRVRGYRITLADCGGIDSPATAVWEAINDGVEVINMSFSSTTESPTNLAALREARDQGILLVAGAGNESSNCKDRACYPAAWDEVISVGAHNSAGTAATFSNTAKFVEIWAPGKDILTTKIGGYEAVSGTSVASPHVAGAGALLMALGGQFAEEARMSMVNNLAGDLGRLDIGQAIQNRNNRAYPDGTWVKSRVDSKAQIYLLESGTRRPATSQALDSWGVSLNQVVEIADAELNSFPLSTQRVGFRPGSLVALSTSGSLLGYSTSEAYLISNENAGLTGQANRWLRSDKYRLLPTAMATLGFKPARIRIVDQTALNWHVYSPAPGHDATLGWTGNTYPNGAIIKTTVSGVTKTWMVHGGVKRELIDTSVIGTWGAAADTVVVPPTATAPVGNPGTLLGYRIGTVLRVDNPLQRWVIVPGSSDWGAGPKRNFAGTFTCYDYPKEVVPEQTSYVNTLHPSNGTDMAC